jgi:hypothetical protein
LSGKLSFRGAPSSAAAEAKAARDFAGFLLDSYWKRPVAKLESFGRLPGYIQNLASSPANIDALVAGI